jgi:hypothetical protein
MPRGSYSARSSGGGRRSARMRLNGVNRTTRKASKKTSSKPKKWIQAAHLKKGTFTKYCLSIGEKGVTKKCIAQGKKSSDPKTRKRAVLAQTFQKMAGAKKTKKKKGK